jgi:glutathione S-transferase
VTTLFDLATQSDKRPSPYCWRAKLALIHKGVEFESRAASYSEIPSLGDGSFKTLPVLNDADTWIGGSTNIAEYLEQRYFDTAALFPDDPQRLFARFVEVWVDRGLQLQIFPLVAFAIWTDLPASEREYFRRTREYRLGTTLESARDQSVNNLPQIRQTLEPLRVILRSRKFLGGERPAYVDYLVFGALKWQRIVIDLPLIESNDAIDEWYERIDQLVCSPGAPPGR